MNDSNNQIKIGAVISYLAIAINVLMSLFYLPWMASQVGQSNYGLYTLANSVVAIFLVDFGLGSAIARFLAKYRAENDVASENIVFSVVVKWYLIIDIGISLVLIVTYFFLGRIYQGLTLSEIDTLGKLYIVVALFGVISFPCMTLNGALTAHEKFVELKLCELGQKMLATVLIVIALLNRLSVVALVLANAISGVLFIALKVWLVKVKTGIRFSMKLQNDQIAKGVMSFSMWMALSSICQRFYFSFAPTILGVVSDSHEIAVFAPANALEGCFYTIAAAVNGLFLAKISRYIANKEEDKIAALMVKIGRYQLFVTGYVFIGYICVGYDFFIRWMGSDYKNAYYCCILLFMPDLLGFTQQIGNTAIIAKNQVKQSAIGHFIATIVCLVISFTISGTLGALGASISISVGYFISFVNNNVIFERKLGISVKSFFQKCFLSFLVPHAITIAAGLFLNLIMTEVGWGGIILKAMVITVVYVIVGYRFALTAEEKRYFKMIIDRGK